MDVLIGITGVKEMKVKGRIVVLLMAFSLLCGVGITYFGMNLMANQTAQPPMSLENGQSFGENVQGSESYTEKIDQTLQVILNSYVTKVDEQQLVEGAIQGMIQTLDDPYSIYMDQETASQFSQSLDSSFEGIGAEVSMVNGKVTIVAPFKGSPAEKAGLKPKDQIVKVDGESIEGLDLYEAVLKIRGEKGSVVQLDVKRPGVSEVLKINVTRDEIPIETVYSSMKNYGDKKVGYIEITSFSEGTAKRFKEELEKFEEEGMDGLIIDLRGNPGGYLKSVEDISKLIIPNHKPFVQIENREGEKQRVFSTLKEKKDYPIVGLIDKGSASASEILASALKEAGGYEIVGQTSFGKGTVQQALPFEDGSQLKLTLYKWLTPDGHWIHQKGVEPTVAVRQPEYFYTNPLQIEEALVYNDNNEQIANAQKMLKGLGFETGRVDGYFNKKTEVAVKAFQKSYDIPITGKIDQKTAAMLESKIIEEVKAEENDVQLQTALQLLFQ